MSQREHAWLQTATGGVIDVLGRDPDAIRIEDIACGLANVPRYAGQTRGFYSVAMHSVCMAEEMLAQQGDTTALARLALLHDAAEAYIGDLASPVKALLPGYKEIEAHIMVLVLRRFDLPPPDHYRVAEADLRMRATEVRDLFPDREPRAAHLWKDLPWPYERRVRFHTPVLAREAFEGMARKLGLWPDNDKAA